jgi:hypothetical protein
MMNAVFRDVARCGSCENRNFGGIYRLHYPDDKNRWARKKFSIEYQPKCAAKNLRQLLVTANIVLIWPILFIRMMEAISSFETPLFARTTRSNIQEDDILHSHNREHLKFYRTTLVHARNPNIPLHSP